MTSHASERYAALVWVFSACALFTYGIAGFFGFGVPGIEQLVAWLSHTQGVYLYIAAFLAIFIEGLYFVGTFFPGTTLIVILAIFAQVGGMIGFFITVGTVFVGWSLAGAVNIFMATRYRHLVHAESDATYEVKDRLFTTWFPAFRANYEVAQVTQSGQPWAVLFSSVRVKFICSVGFGVATFLLPYFIDIKTVSNEEGFLTLGVVATTMLAVGSYKLWHARVHQGITL